MKLFALICLLFLTSSHAQVNRCINPKTGAVTYSDTLCDSRQKSTFIEARKTNAELRAIQTQADEANDRRYRAQESNIELPQQRQEQSIPQKVDKSASTDCQKAKKEHETVSTIMSGTSESRRARFNAATAKVNAACGTSSEMIQEPIKQTIIINNPQPAAIVRCDRNFCYDDRGGVHNKY